MMAALRRFLNEWDGIVRCGRGHLYRTWVVPWWLTPLTRGIPSKRWQHCPVGRHWTLATRVPPEELTAGQAAAARRRWAL